MLFTFVMLGYFALMAFGVFTGVKMIAGIFE